MESERYQKELFEFEAPKRPKARFGHLFQKTDFAITLTAEKLVFGTIGVLMLLVVFFALGVERGKSVAVKPAIPQALAQVQAAQAPVKPVTTPMAQTNSAAGTTNITTRDSATRAQAALDTTNPYTIVAATFKKQELASKEVSRLKASGLEGFVIRSEPYYLACVGVFANKESAQKVLSKVRQIHRDAYVRLK